MIRSITFWVHEMRLGEGRLLKEVVREAMKFKDTVLFNLCQPNAVIAAFTAFLDDTFRS